MQRVYTLDGKEYRSVWQLKRALLKKGIVLLIKLETADADFLAKHGITYVEEEEPTPTPEEIAAAELAEAKRLRAAQVAAITVDVDGMLFNGDETSQDRMSRALRVAEITGMESTNWVLANDQVATVTVAQMKQALAKSMLTQGSYWTKPYDNAEEEVTEDAAS